MFSCFLPNRRGSGLKKERRWSLTGLWRRLVTSRPRRRSWCPFCWRTSNVEQDQKEVPLMVPDPDRVGSSASGKLAHELLPSVLSRDPDFVPAFLNTYPRYGSTQKVLQIMFKRYGCIVPCSREDGDAEDQLKMAMYHILESWLDLHIKNLYQSPDLYYLTLLESYVGLNMPGSELQRRVHLLLDQLSEVEDVESSEDKPECKEALEPKIQGRSAPAPVLEHGPDPGPVEGPDGDLKAAVAPDPEEELILQSQTPKVESTLVLVPRVEPGCPSPVAMEKLHLWRTPHDLVVELFVRMESEILGNFSFSIIIAALPMNYIHGQMKAKKKASRDTYQVLCMLYKLFYMENNTLLLIDELFKCWGLNGCQARALPPSHILTERKYLEAVPYPVRATPKTAGI